MAAIYRRRRKPPPEPHPIDVHAHRLRSSVYPRWDLADAIDDLNGAWARSDFATPIETVLNHIRTLALASIEAEKSLGRNLSRESEPRPRIRP